MRRVRGVRRYAGGPGSLDGYNIDSRPRSRPRPTPDRPLPTCHVALAARDAPPGDAHARGSSAGSARARPRLAAEVSRRAGNRAASTAPARLDVHPPLRGSVDGRRSAVLRRPPDGSRLPAHVWSPASRQERDGEQLVAARADVGRRARAERRSWLLAVAEHRSVLRLALGGELLAHQLVDDLGIRPSLGLLHHLADEEAEQTLLAAAERLDLSRIGGQDPVDQRLELCRVTDRLLVQNILDVEHRRRARSKRRVVRIARDLVTRLDDRNECSGVLA